MDVRHSRRSRWSSGGTSAVRAARDVAVVVCSARSSPTTPTRPPRRSQTRSRRSARHSAPTSARSSPTMRNGEPPLIGSWAASPHEPCTDDDLADMPWLLQRVVRNAVVAVTTESDYPDVAAADRAHAARTGIVARLAVPVVLGSSVCFAMMLGLATPAPRVERRRRRAPATRRRNRRQRASERLRHSDEPHPLVAVRRSKAIHPGTNGGIIGEQRRHQDWRSSAWIRSRRSTSPSCCSAKPARARSCSRGPCTSAAAAVRSPSYG